METLDLEQLVDQYLRHCRFEKGLDAKTLKAYKIDLTQFNAYAINAGAVYNRECLQAYIASLHKKYAVKTAKRKIASAKAYLNYLEFEGIIEKNPFSKMQIKLHEPIILPKTIPLPIISKLLQCAYDRLHTTVEGTYQYRTVLRDITVLELLFATGMRISELCALRDRDVDLAEGSIRIYGKGAKERYIQIENRNVLEISTRYFEEFVSDIAKTGWFFVNRLGNRLSDQSVRGMINKYCQMAGIALHITPHMFRHSFATLLLEEDVDIRYIQHLLGHSSIVTTQIYTHVAARKQRDILAAKHPRNKINTI